MGRVYILRMTVSTRRLALLEVAVIARLELPNFK